MWSTLGNYKNVLYKRKKERKIYMIKNKKYCNHNTTNWMGNVNIFHQGEGAKAWMSDKICLLFKYRASLQVAYVNGADIGSVFIWLASERSRWELSQSDLSSHIAKGDQCKVPLACSTKPCKLINSLRPVPGFTFTHTQTWQISKITCVRLG